MFEKDAARIYYKTISRKARQKLLSKQAWLTDKKITTAKNLVKKIMQEK